ncbi:MAG: SRPBCC domain-containing protein [Bacteroidota bacterium]|nr:SRPBCC domain-containing protein [Bacteroidota bacterium]
MQNQSFSITFLVNQTAEQVFNSVNNVRGWWSQALEGQSEKLNDEFVYRNGEIHYSKHRIVESIPGERVVWLTLDSKLTFVEKQNEWNDTKVVFEITKEGDKTRLTITHDGLVPDFQCYEGCSEGWTYYLQNSLIPLIAHGKGNPD